MLTDAHLPVSYPDVRYAYHPFEPVLADCCQLCYTLRPTSLPRAAASCHCCRKISSWQSTCLTLSISHCTSARLSMRYHICDTTVLFHPYLHLATSGMWCWSAERGILRKLSPCYSFLYYYNDAQRYEQSFQVGRLYGLWSWVVYSLSSDRLCIFNLHGAMYIVIFLVTSFSLPFSELSMMGLAVDLVH